MNININMKSLVIVVQNIQSKSEFSKRSWELKKISLLKENTKQKAITKQRLEACKNNRTKLSGL